MVVMTALITLGGMSLIAVRSSVTSATDARFRAAQYPVENRGLISPPDRIPFATS